MVLPIKIRGVGPKFLQVPPPLAFQMELSLPSSDDVVQAPRGLLVPTAGKNPPSLPDQSHLVHHPKHVIHTLYTCHTYHV